jgi:hypothetical protein
VSSIFAWARRRLHIAVGLVLLPALAPSTVLAAQHLGQRTLDRGDRGHDVRVLQDFLTQTGFATPVAGVFGPQTQRNVRRFERAHDLTVDGIAGPRVVAALRDAVPSDASARRSGGAGVKPRPAVAARRHGPPGRARLRGGRAIAPRDAPRAVRAVIAAGNRIATKPYIWGGGHGRWWDRGYDCSGSVSFALHGGGLLGTTLTSGGLAGWGYRGPGRWITVYANRTHVFMVVAGLRFDTSGASPSRWQGWMRSGRGFAVRHPARL